MDRLQVYKKICQPCPSNGSACPIEAEDCYFVKTLTALFEVKDTLDYRYKDAWFRPDFEVVAYEAGDAYDVAIGVIDALKKVRDLMEAY